jgi:S-adenosylmethionine:tRNA ribosyltransferase-isomerase
MVLDLLTDSYDYALPQEAIASEPIYPRDHAKLLVYDRKSDKVTHTIFRELLCFVPKEVAVFLNDTRVIKARLFGKKEIHGVDKEGRVQGGGRVELLLNKPVSKDRFLVMIRGRVKEGQRLYFDEELVATVEACNEDGSRVVSFEHQEEQIGFDRLVVLLDCIGSLPLPPYMQRKERSSDERDYQSLFAKKAGAVAAPTASLHFTPALFEALQARHQTHHLTLHIGAGTFKPVDAKEILDHPMHSEVFEIPLGSAEVLESNQRILAIGTTVTRTIEHYHRTKALQGECDLFLNPHNPPQRVDHLLTNFHLPKSTLIMLVASFIGREKALALYEEAIEREYRFFSYGDAMLIL